MPRAARRTKQGSNAAQGANGLDVRGIAERLEQSVQQQLSQVEGSELDPVSRSRVTTQLAMTLQRLQKLREPEEIDEKRFLQSAPGQRIFNAISSVLEKSNDAALLLRLADALEELE